MFLMGTLVMVAQVLPTCDFVFVDSTGDTVAWIRSSDGVDASFAVSVTRDPSGEYVYTYRFHVLPTSNQHVEGFVVQVAGWDTTRDTFIVLDSMRAPAGWEASATPVMGYYPPSLDPRRDSVGVAYVNPYGDTIRLGKMPPRLWNPRLRHRKGRFSWISDSRDIPPGDSLDSLVVYAPYPPDPAHYELRGNVFTGVSFSYEGATPMTLYEAILNTPLGDSAFEAADTCWGRHARRRFPFAGVAPGWPVPNWPAAHAHLQDRIQRVDSLGWFRDAALRDTLITRLSAAYAAYKRRDYWEAYQHLLAAMTRLQQGRGSQIDDRGFFVLYYRFLEAREKLPSPARMEKAR